MREIKFRGKCIDNGQWVEGDLITRPVHHDCVILEHGCINYAVNPSTVGQFTGLKDKNGKEIWEGDIMTSPFWGICIIVWNESIYAFQYAYDAVGKGTAIGGRATNTLYDTDGNEFEVTGNIHDNAELLK